MSIPTASNADRTDRKARRRLCATTALGRLAIAILAIGAWAVPSDSEQPIHIQADEGNYDPASGTSVLTGAVQVDQGTLRLRAATVTLSNGEDGELLQIVAEGTDDEPATFHQRLKVGEPPVSARALRIGYAVREGLVELNGSAFLAQNDREFSGETIFWNIDEGSVDARSDEPGGVRLKWQPTPKQNAD